MSMSPSPSPSPRKTALLAALLLVACSSGSGPAKPPPSGGQGGASEGGSGGSSGAGGTITADASPGGAGGAAQPDATAATADTAPRDTASDGPPPTSAGGVALFVVGNLPLTGDDILIGGELKNRGLTVETILDQMATPMSAAGKKLVVISYSVDSEFVAGKFADVPAAVMVMEHNLLGVLGMTAATAHGWAEPATQITITAPESPIAAGFTGDVTIYSRSGEVFWGVPSAAAIKVASVKGNAARSVMFAYPAGAMMVSKPAPGKRFQFFFGGHAVPQQYLNPAGLKLLDAAIDWCVQ